MVVVKLFVSENKHDTSLLRVYDDDIYHHNSSVHPHTPHPPQQSHEYESRI